MDDCRCALLGVFRYVLMVRGLRCSRIIRDCFERDQYLRAYLGCCHGALVESGPVLEVEPWKMRPQPGVALVTARESMGCPALSSPA